MHIDGFISPAGTLNREDCPRAAGLRRDPLSRFVRWLDALLRRRQHIYEFTDDPRCVLRASLEHARHNARLADGILVWEGEPILELHLWNEHIPRLPRGGPSMAWALQANAQLRCSLAWLARHVATEPHLRSIRALHGRAVFVPRHGQLTLRRIAARHGFEIIPHPKLTLPQRIHDFFENLLLFGLTWAFSPGSLRRGCFNRPRHELWISRDVLLRLHGTLLGVADGDTANPAAGPMERA